MTLRSLNPDTHEYIQTATEFSEIADRIARRSAGLPEYDMDDPGRPFTPEYDEPVIKDDTVVDIPKATHTPTPLEQKIAGILQRVRERESAKALVGSMAVNEEAAQEDVWASMGGGHNTYQHEGYLPVGATEDARTYIARDRGGRLVMRVELSGKFLDIPVRENGQSSNWRRIEEAKEQLSRGIGSPVAVSRHRSKR